MPTFPPDIWVPIKLTLELAAISTLSLLVVATPLAWWLSAACRSMAYGRGLRLRGDPPYRTDAGCFLVAEQFGCKAMIFVKDENGLYTANHVGTIITAK